MKDDYVILVAAITAFLVSVASITLSMLTDERLENMREVMGHYCHVISPPHIQNHDDYTMKFWIATPCRFDGGDEKCVCAEVSLQQMEWSGNWYDGTEKQP